MDADKLKQLITTDPRFIGKTPEEIYTIGSVEDQPLPPPPPAKIVASTWDVNGLAGLSVADIASVVNPPKKMQSPPGTPGSWFLFPEDGQFRLYWDSKPQLDVPLFKTEADGEAFMTQWYADHPPIEVKDEIVDISPVELAKP